jgi:glycosyltransferase involved in cell wall biosynthesis
MTDHTLGHAPRAVRVASHRRSGAHLAIEYLTRQLGCAARKSHDFPDVPIGLPTVYVVRDPIDVLWSTYRWFCKGVGGTLRMTHALEDLSFAEYLAGAGGPLVGYDSMTELRAGSPQDQRGMFYDPIRYWADHIRAFCSSEPAPLIIRYQSLVGDPRSHVEQIAQHLDVMMPDGFEPISREDLVGHAPSPPGSPPAVQQWDGPSLRRLAQTAGDVIEQFGFTTPDTVRPTAIRRGERADVRYVARTDNSGYAVAARRCIEALASVGLDVAWEPQPNEFGQREPINKTTPAALLDRYKPDVSSDITIMHTMPDRWAAVRRSLGRGRYIGHTVWELEQFPESWHQTIFAANRLWVPTAWNRRTFAEGDVIQPIDVLPHVISNEPTLEPPIDLPDDVTVFVTVASWHPRKRPDWAIEAFTRAFTREDPVVLVVKTAGWTECWPAASEIEKMTWWQTMQVLRRHADPPNVMLVNDDFTDAEVNGLIARADCYVSLARAEGWGLGLFDAAVMGTPVITTGFGGHLAYLGDDHPGLVPYRMEQVADVEDSPHFEDGMQWAEPDLDVAAAMMRSIVDGTSTLRAAAAGLSERLRTTYSPEAVGRTALGLLQELR